MKKIFIILLFCLLTKNVWATTKVIIQDSPPQTYPNQEFNVVFNIINDFISSDSYYVKGRIGSASASLNKGETYNPITNNWLSDTSSWSNFPIINFNNDTIATASVKLRANQTVFMENNLLVVRVNKNGNYDSSSTALLIIEPTLTSIPTPTLTITPTSTIAPTIGSDDPTPTPIEPTPTDLTDLTNIYLSEAMVNPITGEKEWIEIYNDNDFPVYLNNWYVDDLENFGSSPKIFSLKIDKKSYGVFNLASSMFNNDGDSVRLLDFDKNVKDDFEYQGTEAGKTLGRTFLDSDDFCLQEPSKNSVNNSCINSSPAPTSIATTETGQVGPPPTIIKPASLNKSVLTNQLIDGNQIKMPVKKNAGTVLGASNELMINSSNNKLLIDLLIVLSASYSLLTISSILFRMKLSYGKNKNFYSSSFYSS